MLSLAIVLTVMGFYLIAGANFSRNRYAEILFERQQISLDTRKVEAAKERLVELQGINSIRNKTIHNSSCRQHEYDYVKTCSCGAVGRIDKERADIRAIISGSYEPPNVLAPMIAWPVYKMESFLKGGTVNKPNYALIAELEEKELR